VVGWGGRGVQQMMRRGGVVERHIDAHSFNCK